MTVHVPIARSFKIPYTCECGAERLVFAAGLDPRLPVSAKTRTTGPCAGCGREQAWRIETRDREYVITIEEASNGG